MEQPSNTPDFILARFMAATFAHLSAAITARDAWYGIRPAPGWRMDAELAGYLSAALPQLHEIHPQVIYEAIGAFRAQEHEPPGDAP